ncbi:hypothetical protein RAMLITH_15890 [Ramlibacter sp. RBP-2]|uniref:Uncharacterized protein n=1 Tax=Ramlibacter lithotrophicus TaxID=2606681 RepID=A0A7X6DHL5_9BURK|nr:hypothetical protein [Ramlibacter lithotrophicus]NKE67307.1 hypothetical protein [Ramlibacter lithotrophicus]
MDAAVLVPLDAAPADADAAPAASQVPGELSQAPSGEAQALASALAEAQDWTPEILTLALASLGDIDLPAPAAPPRHAGTLAVLPTLYWVWGLDQAGLLQAAETVAGLWASGAIQVPLPDRGQALQDYWRARRQRLTAPERAHLLGLVFDPRDFEPALRRLCTALVALADNAGQRDVREEVGLQVAAAALLDLGAARLEGAPAAAAADLLAQTRAAVALLSPRALQTAFAVRDFYALIELSERAGGRQGQRARRLAERAQAGAAVLRWLATAAAQGFAIDPQAAQLQTLMAHAQRWLSNTEPGAAEPGHDHDRLGVAAA